MPSACLQGLLARLRQFSFGEGTWKSSISLDKTKDSSFKISQRPEAFWLLSLPQEVPIQWVEWGAQGKWSSPH